MYRARDQVDNAEWLEELEAAVGELELSDDARSYATDLFLSANPDEERSKRPVLAASLYAGALIAGEERSQTVVAEVFGVSRFSIQQRWKDLIDSAGFTVPRW